MDKVEHISEEIKFLIIRCLTDLINEEESLRLKHWMEENNLHKAYFDKLKASWILAGMSFGEQKTDAEAQWTKLQSKMRLEPAIQPKQIKTKTRVLTLVGIAASWLVFFALGSLSSRSTGKAIETTNKTTEITAPLGSKSIVKLPDGTTVWLNAGSKITYSQDFDKKERNIQLTGEAYFKVATNKAKPFIVKTSGILVRALGTRFNVKAYPEEKTITATLEEGKIDVQVLKKADGKNKIELKPNQKVVYYKKSNEFEDKVDHPITNTYPPSTTVSPKTEDLEVAVNVNTELYTSWKDPRWIIEALPLASLSPMLERRFNMKIKFESEDLKHYKFTGTIEKETIEQILAAMRFTAPIDYDIQKDTITLTLNKHLKNQYSRLTKSKTN